ncbi:hypothetical protein ZYGR_0H03910 [Zygosaccharomyces rouxii]|uniref:ZYRO0B12958p n=2 Tax=Zygosaccharomyces rouxii TaxID=4956 RepID=C5DS12_ZYGRC|nr:uncharacterized protein ZYRO0B12958g [Zygosaccharomyces rouxii]KAH9199898.1 vacuolar sorting protein 39 domain 1-domain-containing protein [Zygosaccharomyces rouxii]GAV47545.1 hypothetical protein ZYGR_0H03910 [Zygosaccharomyces rouxii]CAR26573.1 ZYRO0B12958p [Zygosaccharomyces rouxii]
MLKCKLVDSVPSQGITAILHNPETHKLVVAKDDQSVQVYSRESHSLRLIQTYPQLLQNSRFNDDKVQELYGCKPLSTIFARCDKSLLLYDSINFHKYDQIVDRRGIEKCWIMETPLDDSEDVLTALMYATKNRGKLRMLIWEGRTYKRVVEATLPNRGEFVLSSEAESRGVILATTHGIYHWPYGDSFLVKIDKIVRRKYPGDLVSCLAELTAKTREMKVNGKSIKDNDSTSFMSSSRLTKRSSFTSLWSRRNIPHKHAMNSVKSVFKTTDSDKIMILDGFSKNLFQLGCKDNHEFYLFALDLSQFMEWNQGLQSIRYLSGLNLILNNSHEFRVVDYQYGFTFLEQSVEEGIKWVEPIGKSHFIIWTLNDQLHLYRYQLEDDTNDLLGDDRSLCGISFDTDFNKLWRKVIFYQQFLDFPHPENLCCSKNPEASLDLVVLKLRDLTVLWCLEIFARFENCMSMLSSHDQIHDRTMVLQDLIPKLIFDKFLEFWAPPQLIILKCFPPKIARLVPEVTGQQHSCLYDDLKDQRTYTLPAMIIRKWFLPYLTDTRRHLKSIAQKDSITWEHSGRKIDANLNFFLMDKHQTLDVTTLLTLIDTVLFVAYLYYYPSMVGPLLRIDNLCERDVVVRELQERRMFQELVDFYFGRSMHADALEFLTNLITSMDQDDNTVKFQDGVKVLVVDYLKKLPLEHQGLLFHYLDWLLKRFGKDSALMESVFMNETPACASRNHYQIYEYIDKMDKTTAIRYLEFVISAFGSKDVKLHTTLVKLYFDDMNNPTTKMKLKSVLESTSVYEPRTILRLLNELSDNKGDPVSQQQHNFISLLKTFPLQKLGDHHAAINIFYDDLSDYNATSSYCKSVYTDHPETGKDSLNYFFQKILNKYAKTGNSNEILYFLQEHGNKINIIKIYEILPKELSLNQFKDIFLQTVKSHSIARDETKLTKNLLQVELINKGYDLNRTLSEYSILGENYECPVCNKHFSTFTTDTLLLFTFDKKKVVVHYNCGRALQAKIQNKRTKAQQKAHRVVSDLKEIDKIG